MTETALLTGPQTGPQPSGSPSEQALAMRRGIRRLTAVGLLVVAVFFGGIGAWSALAPLSSAAIATGTVVSDSQRKTIQHLEGGIIAALHVTDGSHVQAGDVLVSLDATGAGAKLEELQNRQWALMAQEARLIAERDRAAAIAFPAELTERAAERPEVAALLDGQRNVFQTRRTALESQEDILSQKVAQYDEQISGLQAQVDSQSRQLALIRDELSGVRELYSKGAAPKTRVLALERTEAELEGQRGELLAEISRVRQAIGETKLNIIDVGHRFLNSVVGELQKAQEDLTAVRERLREAKDVVARTEVRAPRAGTVVDLRFHTTGGVVPPGAAILDLVPDDDALVIEARVRPDDIDVVHANMPAEVRLTAFDQRSTPTLTAQVTRVSADRLVEERSGEAYYEAQVRIDADSLDDLGSLKLYPGMPAEVMIKTGDRTALDILVSPISHSLNRAFREQ